MYPLLKRFLFVLEPELSHALVKRVSPVLPKALLGRFTQIKDETLKAHIGKTVLANPVGLAAGFDKNAEVLDFMAALGFGFIEIGSVTAFPCPGNPKPRLFRLPKDESLINRLGLPNQGVEKIALRLKDHRSKIPIGINIAKTPTFVGKRDGIEDMLTTLKGLHGFGAYLVFNLSCPNTIDGKTFENPEVFKKLAFAYEAEKRRLKISKPALLKLSPDLPKSDLQKIVETASPIFDGFVVSNTSTHRSSLLTDKTSLGHFGLGGLSGKGLRESANQQLALVSEMTGSSKMLIGVGGVMNFKDLLTKLSLGASLVQVYTGLIYRGPLFIRELNRELSKYCRRLGLPSYRDLIGNTDHPGVRGA